jgi:hypothetical protein
VGVWRATERLAACLNDVLTINNQPSTGYRVFVMRMFCLWDLLGTTWQLFTGCAGPGTAEWFLPGQVGGAVQHLLQAMASGKAQACCTEVGPGPCPAMCVPH